MPDVRCFQKRYDTWLTRRISIRQRRNQTLYAGPSAFMRSIRPLGWIVSILHLSASISIRAVESTA